MPRIYRVIPSTYQSFLFNSVSKTAADIRTTKKRAILPTLTEPFRVTDVKCQHKELCDAALVGKEGKRHINRVQVCPPCSFPPLSPEQRKVQEFGRPDVVLCHHCP